MASGKAAALLAAAALVMTPAIGLAAAEKKRAPSISLSFNKIPGFTPAGADPRLAAIFANKAPALTDFKFTPAAAKSRPSQIRVALRSSGGATPPTRPVEVAVASPINGLAAAKYDLGLAVGWKRLAVAGDVGRTSSPDPVIGTRETAVVGVSYNLKRFTGRVAVGGERNESRITQLARPDSVSVDLGGSYNISRNIAVNGGVRYKIERDQIPALAEDRRDSKAVYVGTALKF
ncbi:MAG TPA: hypothetical protein VGD23_00590 [Sphingomicrobium sp.]